MSKTLRLTYVLRCVHTNIETEIDTETEIDKMTTVPNGISVLVQYEHLQWRIQGRELGTPPPHSPIQILSFSCSFLQIFGQIIDRRIPFRVSAPNSPSSKSWIRHCTSTHFYASDFVSTSVSASISASVNAP